MCEITHLWAVTLLRPAQEVRGFEVDGEELREGFFPHIPGSSPWDSDASAAMLPVEEPLQGCGEALRLLVRHSPTYDFC